MSKKTELHKAAEALWIAWCNFYDRVRDRLDTDDLKIAVRKLTSVVPKTPSIKKAQARVLKDLVKFDTMDRTRDIQSKRVMDSLRTLEREINKVVKDW